MLIFLILFSLISDCVFGFFLYLLFEQTLFDSDTLKEKINISYNIFPQKVKTIIVDCLLNAISSKHQPPKLLITNLFAEVDKHEPVIKKPCLTVTIYISCGKCYGYHLCYFEPDLTLGLIRSLVHF